MEAVAVALKQMTAGGLHMSNPRYVMEADIAVQAENERLRRDWDRLWLERKEFLREIDRLREENTDLQESALIWINLYEHALEREHGTRVAYQCVVESVSESGKEA